jgi:hypothetical protein
MSLPRFCHTGRTPAAVVLSVMADVIGFCGKLLVLSVKCYGRCNTALSSKTMLDLGSARFFSGLSGVAHSRRL